MDVGTAAGPASGLVWTEYILEDLQAGLAHGHRKRTAVSDVWYVGSFV